MFFVLSRDLIACYLMRVIRCIFIVALLWLFSFSTALACSCIWGIGGTYDEKFGGLTKVSQLVSEYDIIVEAKVENIDSNNDPKIKANFSVVKLYKGYTTGVFNVNYFRFPSPEERQTRTYNGSGDNCSGAYGDYKIGEKYFLMLDRNFKNELSFPSYCAAGNHHDYTQSQILDFFEKGFDTEIISHRCKRDISYLLTFLSRDVDWLKEHANTLSPQCKASSLFAEKISSLLITSPSPGPH